MSDEQPADRSRCWQNCLPCLILLRCFRPAVSVRMLVLGAGGLVANTAGLRLIWGMFQNATDPLFTRWRELASFFNSDAWPLWPWDSRMGADSGGFYSVARESLGGYVEWPGVKSLIVVWEQFTVTFQMLFHLEVGYVGLAYLLLCCMWTLLVWSFFGAAMTRSASLRLARGELASWSDVRGHAMTKYPSYFSAPLFPLVGIFLAMIPIMILGLLSQTGFGLAITGLLWPFALVGGLFMTIIAAGLFFGWPLMWATISTEGTDAFDALSRSYAYVFQRPLHCFVYALAATLIGSVGWVVVSVFVSAVSYLTLWSASWGAPDAIIVALRGGFSAIEASDFSSTEYFGAWLICFWMAALKLLVVGYMVSFFWSATSGVYLLLRRDVDAMEMDEVYLSDQEKSYGLPPLSTDEAGVPGVAESEPSEEG